MSNPPKFDPRSLDDEFQPISPHPSPKSKAKWPATRVLGWVIAIGGLSVTINIISVEVVYAAMARMDAAHSTNEQLRADVNDLKQVTSNLTAAMKALSELRSAQPTKGNSYSR